MKISPCHHENFDLLSLKSRPIIMKIRTCHHENTDLTSRKPQPFIIKSQPVINYHQKISNIHNKFSTFYHKNIDLQSWKSWPVTIKISTCHHDNTDLSSRKSRPFIKNLDLSSFVIKKISNIHNTFSTFHHEILDLPSLKPISTLT